MKILITGSSGMLGRALCKVLGGEHELIGIDIRHCEERSDEAISRFYKIDLSDKIKVKDAFKKECPDIVIHAAAWTDVDGCEENPDKAHEMNVEVTKNVAEALRNIKTFPVYISTDFVFNGSSSVPYTEEDDTDPINVYGKTKLEGEKVFESLERYAIVRTSWLFGGNGKNFVDTILKASRENKSIRIVDDQMGSPTYTGDLAVALKQLAGASRDIGREVFHVSNAGQCSWYGFAKEILKKNENVRVEAIKSEELKRPAERPKYSVLDNSKFERIVGYKMRCWKEALGEYLSGLNS